MAEKICTLKPNRFRFVSNLRKYQAPKLSDQFWRIGFSTFRHIWHAFTPWYHTTQHMTHLTKIATQCCKIVTFVVYYYFSDWMEIWDNGTYTRRTEKHLNHFCRKACVLTTPTTKIRCLTAIQIQDVEHFEENSVGHLSSVGQKTLNSLPSCSFYFISDKRWSTH